MKNLTIAVVMSAAVFAPVVQASDRGHIDYARVVDARPVYEQVAESTPYRECWNEPVRYERPARSRSSATGTILGTMIGAAVGHNVARSKDGQKVGRIAGAVLGASIGHDVSGRSRGRRVEVRDEQRCQVRHATEYRDVLVGYDVAYRYRGRTYHTRMDENPGRRIRVAVDVRPVY